MKPFTFSDGTFIPEGAYVATGVWGVHFDGKLYPDPDEFKGFRFADLRGQEDEELKHTAAAPSHEWMSFGYGKHAW